MTFLHGQRTFQMFDLETVVLFGVTMPRTHFHSIRSVYLNAKYLAPHTSFTTPISHFPRPYRARFSDLPTAPSLKACATGQRCNNLCNKTGSTCKPPAVVRHHRSIWHAACQVFGQMQSLHRLEMQLSFSAFIDVLSGQTEEKKVRNEDWVFEPLVEVAKARGPRLRIFRVEVDWPDGGDGWDSEEKGKGFELSRVEPRSRGW